MKTFYCNKHDKINRKWYIIDAKNMILGRLSSHVAMILQGKNKSYYTPHVDVGDYIIIINAKNIILSGQKDKKKIYWRYSQYPGGIKQRKFSEERENFPERVIHHSVKGMMPKGILGRQMIKKLKIYKDNNHPHGCHLPNNIDL